MAIKQDIGEADNSLQAEIRVPLILGQKTSPADKDGYGLGDQTGENSKGHEWMVYLTTFVAVCGSFAFGSCVRTHAWSRFTFYPENITQDIR